MLSSTGVTGCYDTAGFEKLWGKGACSSPWPQCLVHTIQHLPQCTHYHDPPGYPTIKFFGSNKDSPEDYNVRSMELLYSTARMPLLAALQ